MMSREEPLRMVQLARVSVSPPHHRKSRSLVGCVLLIAGLLLAAGCSGKDSGPTGTVTGAVQLKGQPLPAGHAVVFTESKSGRVAYGITDAEGKFRLASSSGGNVPVGRYEVAVRPPDPEGDAGSGEPAAENHADGAKKAAPKLPFAKKYLESSASGLVHEVKAGENNFTIDLTE